MSYGAQRVRPFALVQPVMDIFHPTLILFAIAPLGLCGVGYLLWRMRRESIWGIIVCLQAYFWLPKEVIFGGQQVIIGLVFLYQFMVISKRRRWDAASARTYAMASRYVGAMSLLAIILLIMAFASHLLYQSPIGGGFFRYIVKFLSYILFGATVILSIRTLDDCLTTVKYFALTAFLSASIVGLIQYFTGITFVGSAYYVERYAQFGERFRLVTFTQFDANYAMLDLIPATLTAFALAHLALGWMRGFWYTAFVAGGVASLLTFSRSGAAVLAVSFLFLVLVGRMYRLRNLMALAVAAAGLWVVLSQLGVEWFLHESNIDRLSSTMTLSWRLSFMMTAFQSFLEHPLLGVGGTDLSFYMLQETGSHISAHSFYLTVLFHHGLIGAILIGSMLSYPILVLIYTLWRPPQDRLALWQALCAMMLSCYIGYLLFIGSLSDTLGFYVCFYTAFACAIKSVANRARTVSNPYHQSYEITATAVPHTPGIC